MEEGRAQRMERCMQGRVDGDDKRVVLLLLLLLLPILCRAAFYCRIIAHWRSGQEELVRS